MTARVVLAHLGPGILGGDRYASRVRLEPDAVLGVTGQMATPVYACRGSSSTEASWDVATGGALSVRTEPVMLDAGATHDMFSCIDMAPDATAIFADIVTVAAGAVARLRTTVRVNERLVLRDACDLRARPGAVATVLVVAGGAARRAAMTVAAQGLLDGTTDVRGGLGGTPAALVLRATSDRVWALQRLIDCLLSAWDVQTLRSGATVSADSLAVAPDFTTVPRCMT